MNGPNRQRGMTAISWLLLLAVAGFFLLLGMRLGPIYLENYTVKSVLASIKEEYRTSPFSLVEVKRRVENRLYINEVRRITHKHIKIKKVDGGYSVQIKYDVRQHIAWNIDAIVMFDDTVEMVSR